MKDNEMRLTAKEFAAYWKDKGYEKGESQPFWLSLLRDVYGVEQPEKFITFEEQVKLDHTSFIDGHIAATHVLIEQKGRGKDLRKAIRQSDGSLLTPFQQAQRYSAVLPYSQRPRWIVTCNFEEFLVYDMEKPNGEPEQILLKDLEKEYYRLLFLTDTGDENIKREMEVSILAGNLVGILYDEILKQYIDKTNPRSLQSLNMLCVRLVFCLYAEDAGIFGGHNKFHNYIKSFSSKDMRKALIELFKILDTKPEDRDPYEEEMLASFPYVNGGLFADENIEIPQLTDEIRDILLRKASEDFDWSAISPTIFGAVFESTLNPETRRSGGMHYTSIENIHKVIDPLFLDELKEELDAIKDIKVSKTKEDRLEGFRNKLSTLTFLDPACGSGNFLTETYISLRRLENEALEAIIAEQKGQIEGQIILGGGSAIKEPIKVSISQFYGIEINDFAVTVAKTALWIAESQMMKETESVIHMSLDFLPLKSYANIALGNALRIDWETVVPKDKLNYIMGNPPFVGHQNRNDEQIDDMKLAFYDLEKHGKLDYVCAWYNKAADLIKLTDISVAFVSTNSICQGESVSILWKHLFDKGVEIQFAHNSFSWASESNNKATVHCVIVGFSTCGSYKRAKRIFEGKRFQIAENINGYLVAAPNVYVGSRGKQLTVDMPDIIKGSQATDAGNLFITNDERLYLLKQYPQSEIFIKEFVGAEEFINNKKRYCLWFKGVAPSEYRNIPFVRERLERVAEMRLKSPTKSVQKDAETPMLFTQIRQPDSDYLIVPRHSSENRKYIPLGYMTKDVICGDANMLIPNANKYLFGILTSNVHMAWMRTVCGRLEMRYRYTPAVYNNFPWPTPTDEQKAKIELTAQAILDARALYPDCSLADLYDELTMPVELRKAHQANDKAVMQAYGFWGKLNTESECVAELMRMYKELTE